MTWVVTVQIIILLAMMTAGISTHALSWTAFDVDRDVHYSHNPIEGPTTMTFILENNTLNLDNNQVRTVGGSSAHQWFFEYSGLWAVCGSVNTEGVCTPDPYASFIESGPGSGTVQWSDTTPEGYITRLILGGSFTGNGARTYENIYNGQSRGYTTAALALHDMYLGGNAHNYTALSYTFDIANNEALVPEPAGIMLTLWGLGSMAYVLKRKIIR